MEEESIQPGGARDTEVWQSDDIYKIITAAVL